MMVMIPRVANILYSMVGLFYGKGQIVQMYLCSTVSLQILFIDVESTEGQQGSC
jgi:hypothetical protein